MISFIWTKKIHRISSKTNSQNTNYRFKCSQELIHLSRGLRRKIHQRLIKPNAHNFQKCGAVHRSRQ